MQKKLLELKTSWIKRHKEDPDLDYDTIFKDDEDIHDGEKMKFTFLTQQNLQNQDGRIKRQSNEWRKIHKEIPNEEWEFRFKQLLDLSLIEVPENYYEDVLFFTNPADLTAIFTKLEEDNLSKIHDQQELAQAYELLLTKQHQIHERLQKNYDEQNKTRVDLKMKINASKLILTMLRKKNAQSLVFESGQAGDTAVKAGKKQAPVDFTKLLGKFREQIKSIHIKNIGGGDVVGSAAERAAIGAADGKATLALLNEIESRVIKYTRTIQRKRQKNKETIHQFELKQGTDWRTMNSDKLSNELQRIQEERNELMIEKRKKPRHRIGKQPMVRSMKRVMKKKEKVQTIDDERLAVLKYLGHYEDEVPAAGQKP